MLTVARTHRFFVHGLQQAASIGHARAPVRRGRYAYAFRASLFDTVVVKEWRLIARDPHLISQVLLQLVYLLPLFFLVRANADPTGPAVGAGLTLLCSSLAGSLAWIVIVGEDAPDLLLSAPAAAAHIRLAKLAAAAMPPLALVALPLLWLVARAPLTGLLVGFTVTAAVLCAALIVQWLGRPAPRSDFRARGKENFLCSMVELVNSFAGAGWPGCWSLAVEGVAAGSLACSRPGCWRPRCWRVLLAWLLRRRPV